MPDWLRFLCYLAAFVCFLLVAASVATKRVNLLGAGLAVFVLVFLWDAFDRLTN